jgi:hypothetical protein
MGGQLFAHPDLSAQATAHPVCFRQEKREAALNPKETHPIGVGLFYIRLRWFHPTPLIIGI